MTRSLSHRDSVAVDRELVKRGGLYDFLRMAWREIEPSPFLPNWHLEEICHHLEAVSAVQIRDLVINIPPGCGKSLSLNVLWPAWEWIHRPSTKWIYASFDPQLVGQRDGTKLINLLQSEWFVSRWGNLLTVKNPSASMFVTSSGGFRFATSPGGKGTGRHANIVVVDDPIKPIDAEGGGTIDRQRLKFVSDWWGNTMATRQADPMSHRQVVMMQRLARGDLAGEMIDAGYTVLRFPMRYIAAKPCQTVVGQDRRTQDGELLFPTRFDDLAVTGLEKKMGETVAAAQLQQEPQVQGGGIFKRHFWRFWHMREHVREPCMQDRCFTARRCLEPHLHVSPSMCVLLPAAGLDVQSWDMTFKSSDGSDYVAGGVWRSYLAKYYLLDLLNERMSYAETKATFRRISDKWPTTYDKLIEDKANGPAVESDLKLDIPGITLVNPNGGKIARANVASPLLAEHRVFLPHPDLCPLVWVLMAQLEGFPRDTHDDLVDMVSQALLNFRKHGDLFAAAMAKIRGDK